MTHYEQRLTEIAPTRKPKPKLMNPAMRRAYDQKRFEKMAEAAKRLERLWR